MTPMQQLMMFGLVEIEDGRVKRKLTHDERAAFFKACWNEQGLLPVGVAAQLLGVSRQRVYQMISEGKLRRLDLLGCIWIAGREVASFILDDTTSRG